MREEDKIKGEIIEEKMKNLKRKCEEMEEEIKLLKKKNESFQEILNKFFSKGQMKRLLNKACTHWDSEDIADAIALRCMSPRAYRYLQSKKGFPLPALSTLRRWSLKLDIQPGLSGTSILLMKAWGQNMSERDKLTVLSYDETFLSEEVSNARKLIQVGLVSRFTN